jgi:hypothetical protein
MNAGKANVLKEKFMYLVLSIIIIKLAVLSLKVILNELA